MILEFFEVNPGVLAGLGLGSMAGALLLGRRCWRLAGAFDGRFRSFGLFFALQAGSIAFGAGFVLAAVMLLSLGLGS